MIRNSEASNSLKLSGFRGFSLHSHKCLDKYLCKEKISNLHVNVRKLNFNRLVSGFSEEMISRKMQIGYKI